MHNIPPLRIVDTYPLPMPQAAALAQTIQPIPVLPILPRVSEQRFELLNLQIGKSGTKATFLAREDSLVTSKFPGFDRKLVKILPSLLQNVTCYNDQNQPFAVEMLATETGHLFEHVWLEVLCCEKLRTSQSAHYCGQTSWNWRKDQRGLFHVTLNATETDRQLIEYSANISLRILEQVLY